MAAFRSKKARFWIYLCAPFALVAAIVLCRLTPGFRWNTHGLNRSQALDRSVALLAEAGLDPSQFQQTVKAEPDNEALQLTAHQIQAGLPVSALDAPYHIKVKFISRRSKDTTADFEFDPEGMLTGYSLPEAARPLQRDSQVALFTKQFPGITIRTARERPRAENSDDEEAETRYEVADPALPTVTYRLSVKPRSLQLQPRYAPTASKSESRWSNVQKSLAETGKLLLMITGFYALRLFWKRYKDREIPVGRAMLLLAVMIVLGVGSFLLNRDNWIGQSWVTSSSIPESVILGMLAVAVFAAGGLLLGGTYAATESEIREGDPGKLIGVDALLSGNFFSKQNGMAVLDGYALGSLGFLAAVAFHVLAGQWLGALGAKHIERMVSHSPALSMLWYIPLSSVWSIVAGLLIPLAFVHRNPRLRKVRWLLLIGIPLLVDLGMDKYSLLTGGTFISALIWISVLVSAFYFSGLSAVFTAVTVYRFLVDSAGIATLQRQVHVEVSLILAGVVLLPYIYAAWRGRDVTEEEVRPHYAGLLAQRMALRAKVEAARVAQERLMPQGTPQIPGVAISAICEPSGLVGGDFYDFFPLPGERHAILIASGAGPGLPAALTIALAKGYLRCSLPYVAHPAEAMDNFVDTFSHLLMSAKSQAGAALVFLDPAARTIEAARLGPFPLLWTVHQGRATPVAMTPGRMSSSASIQLGDGDVLLVHSRGLTELLEDQSLGGQQKWLERAVRKMPDATPAAVEDALIVRLWGKKRKFSSADLLADFTAVTMAFDGQAAQAAALVSQPQGVAKERAS